MEPLPSEVSSPLQPLQALGVAISASLACAEEMVPPRMLREHYRQTQEQMLKKVLNIEQI